MSFWVLKQRKKRSYFREWTGIGPRFTDKLSLAMRFDTEEEAIQHPTWSFPLTFVEARCIDRKLKRKE